ncbi:MAG: hypothetical protein QOH43_4364 [Solirubrobacteraceae bacterium]|nr:hypothetical protein [Solirubrobacteraceae bacterium]
MPLEGFEVEHFEHVAVSPGTVLLRLSGRWFASDAERLPPPVLVAEDGGRRHRLELLPGPEDTAPLAGPRPAVWRAAFRAPAALVDLPAAFALSLGPGLQLDLPAPSAREGGRPATVAGRLGAPAGPGPLEREDRLERERERELRRAAEQAAAGAGEELLAAQAAAEAERRALVGRAREEVDRARDDAAAARREAAQAARSARAAQDEAQAAARRLAAAEEAAGTQARRADAVESTLGAREDELRAALDEVAELRAALADRERAAAAAAAEAADLRDVLAARDRVGEAAGAEIAALAARVDELEPLAAAQLSRDAQPQPALPPAVDADRAALQRLEATPADERGERRAAAGSRRRRRPPPAEQARGAAPAPDAAAHVVLRPDRRPAIRAPVAVGVLVILVVGSGLLLVALLLKLAIAP